jgi:hypothetical protein
MANQISTPAFTATRMENGKVRVDGKGNNVTRYYELVGDEIRLVENLPHSGADRFPDELYAVRNLI